MRLSIAQLDARRPSDLRLRDRDASDMSVDLPDGGGRYPRPQLVAVLLSLYALQGLVFGLTNGSLPVLLAKLASFTQLSALALASWPFALKGLFAPFVDSYWSRRVGQRKSWVLPCTLLSAACLCSLAANIDDLVAAGRVEFLSAQLFICISCLAAQDVIAATFDPPAFRLHARPPAAAPDL